MMHSISDQQITTWKCLREMYDFTLRLRWVWNVLMEMLAEVLRMSVRECRLIDFLRWWRLGEFYKASKDNELLLEKAHVWGWKGKAEL